jgi:hypothetical protein
MVSAAVWVRSFQAVISNPARVVTARSSSGVIRWLSAGSLAQGRGNRIVGEGELGHVRAADVYAGAEAGGGVEPIGGFAILGGDIDGRDVAAGLGSEETSRSADSGAGIQHSVRSGHPGELDELHGCEPAE